MTKSDDFMRNVTVDDLMRNVIFDAMQGVGFDVAGYALNWTLFCVVDSVVHAFVGTAMRRAVDRAVRDDNVSTQWDAWALP